jgi:hypothetical protein
MDKRFGNIPVIPNICLLPMNISKHQNLLFFLLFFCLAVNAQQSSISGSLTDTVNFKPMAYSSIALIRQKDSILITHRWADDKGNFEFNQLAAGSYILQITRPTFANYEERIVLAENEQKQLGLITLISKANLLQEIIIREKKNAITIKGDTTEYLVDSFLVNKSSNV